MVVGSSPIAPVLVCMFWVSFFRSVLAEFRGIAWPSRREVVSFSLFALSVTSVFALLFAFVDYVIFLMVRFFY
ncbi:preprotein translocase subunit SecE [Neorickettsia risticii]|uniref:preprotein translocase subunit SecE n=1 Tax=Neorickettsia risticii TaxID=950 RepID=UPI0011D106D0|nr:preprotein translocase subunit SecE [Neorickettsia risticii]